MSLTIKNLATAKQVAWLRKHSYYGHVVSLTKAQAGRLIQEIMDEQQLEDRDRCDYLQMIKRING